MSERVWLSEDERESLTRVVRTWLPVSYAGLIPRLELWITDRDAQAQSLAQEASEGVVT